MKKFKLVHAITAALISTGASVAQAGVIDSTLPTLMINGAPGKVFAIATGLRSTPEVATVVHCTNLDSVNVGVGVEFFAFSGVVTNDVAMGEGYTVIAPGFTRTIASQDTAVYAEDSTATVTLNQGSIRIVASSTKLMCRAELIDDANATPEFAVNVPLIIKKQRGN